MRLPLALAFLAAAAVAQSPLTTIYAGGNGLGAGATTYFNLVLNAPLTFVQIDFNCSSTLNTAGTVEVRWTANTYVGNDTNAAAWTLGGSGPATAAGAGQPTTCLLTPFTLQPGSYGFAVTYLGLGVNYTNGNGTTVPGSGTNQTYANNEITMLCGASAGGGVGTAICCQPRVFNGSLHYVVGGGGGTVAQRNNYGSGCYQRIGSLYEYFATSAGFDLHNTSMSFLPAGAGYLVLPGLATYVPPSPTATQLALIDDSEVSVALGVPFPYHGGPTSSLTVCSNGYVSVATGNGTAFTPSIATMLNAPQTAWWNWHDYNPAIAAGGKVKFEQSGGIAYVTWDGVWDFGGTSAANANTFQFQFDSNSGTVHLVFQTLSALGNARLVGFSPGGPSLDPGNTDLSVALQQGILIPGPEYPLKLAASARPLLGTTIQLVTSNEVGTNVGLMFFGLAGIPAPGIDLAFLGAGGCAALVDISQAVGNLIGNFGGLSLSIPLPIPQNTNLLGVQTFAQSLWLDPSANPFGAITSNGVQLILGNL
jgi:hypothetical protein